MNPIYVREVMHQGVVSCSPDTTIRDAARAMVKAGVRALVVTDDACGLVGIVSQTDLVNATLVHPNVHYWDGVRVRDVMTSPVATVTPETKLEDAARMLVEKRIHRLVVVSEDDPCKPVGMLSMGDIVRDLILSPDE
ncbi:MAG: CBS domain-containing protein [Anaerolineae bacterium]|nr:CBS domain-containing protein [Thermoflexales bacterium]MDW8406417.1 CBS domain-containing protein [Anaerolineae bacterium]